MPAFTLGEISSMVTADIGRRADIDASIVSQRVNMAYFEVAQAVPHALLEETYTSSLTSGDSNVTLPTDFGEPISLRLEIYSSQTTPSTPKSYKTLALVPISYIDANLSEDNGEPESFAFFNDHIELDPSADSGYTLQIRYRVMPSDLTDPDSIPSISTPWRMAIKRRAEVLMHEYLGNWPAAQAAQDRYLTFVNTLKEDEDRRQSSQHRMSLNPVYPRVTYR